MVFKRLTAFLFLIAALLLAVVMIGYPEASWQAGVRGLAIWWDVLFPSLFPFFVISEVMLGFGIVHFLGKLLDPLMKPVFRIPGNGGFVLAMGFASGYPVSAKLATKLREQRLVSRIEGERLVSFTTSSDPIFLIGAVSVGFFGNPKLAGALALSHYGGALLIGLVMRFYRPDRDEPASSEEGVGSGRFSLKLALQAMHEARIQDGRRLGELLRQAVVSSLQLMTVVGGLVVFFSVILEVLTASGFMSSLYGGFRHLLPLLGLPSQLAEPLMGGLFEVTLGAKAAAAPEGIPLMYKAAAAAFILSWGGLSVHAQVASILNGADLRYFPFLAARFLHAVLSAGLLLLIWNPLMGSAPAWAIASPKFGQDEVLYGWQALPGAFRFFLVTMAILLILSFLSSFIHRLRQRK
ncbi:sporulation integral membrane protein YlbJ [Paenibacillus sp. MBLB2552]|uniref:Sporulation integral membrane protein YlbJ n=1 Tax=Paenibacillus mellifer TaxID=2937794 RepID=A0A9X1Y421_9BACL|nr:sporulation integral membrane protein YlbJ [Paenibacillus mellifer]MCK8489296.1 sporulation integral membrane protein YlbJ [Paenibacillus mellifer]